MKEVTIRGNWVKGYTVPLCTIFAISCESIINLKFKDFFKNSIKVTKKPEIIKHYTTSWPHQEILDMPLS